MNAQTRPRFGKGVKLRHEPDGGAMLLVPEAALVLNRPAAVALELVDGKRTLAEIVAAVAEQFDVVPERAREDIDELFDRLAERGFLRSLDSAAEGAG
ncbi:MAG: pyrroloquinoline quinone biosynthesis peptide chaperone PqqD [Candidatus Cybelea sp.]|jgi:pyrroloquinoline quinone biosynthesis protein D